MDRPHPGVLIADGLFSPEQLVGLSTAVDQIDLEPQRIGVTQADGLPERRHRGETTDARIPAILWSALAGVLPPLPMWFEQGDAPRVEPDIGAWSPIGCNPRTRVYRYSLGERFASHADEPWRPSSTQRSFLTILVYLPVPGGCMGGETVVHGAVVAVVPGRCVILDHRLAHEGRPVERGAKLVLRSDVVHEASS